MFKTFGQNGLGLCTDPLQTGRAFTARLLETTASQGTLGMSGMMQILTPVEYYKHITQN